MKKLVVLLFVAMMAVPALVAQGAGSTPVPTCLTVTGTAAASPTTVDVEEPIVLTYTLTPGGSYTQVVTRSAANLVMVLDESGSMNFTDDSGRNPPTRMSILKTSAKSLIDQLKTVNLHDKAGLVKFDTTASKLQDLIDATTTSGANTLKTKIDSLNPDGGTNIEHGLRLANTMLTGMSNPYVILVTDGYATHYTNSSGSGVESTSKAKSLALTAADQLAAAKVPVYTVALGKAGSSDVDHTLLTNIAAKTGGKKYDASNTTELTQVFTKIQQEIAKQSTIKTIAIRQPLPAGFTLAYDVYQGAYIEEATNTLVIPVDDISYPYTIANTIVKVNIMKTGEGGTFKLGNAELSYKNACGSIASTSIALNANVT
ncbi:MAG: VWA domain-containing protein, partial [Paenibacillaceae bacterium]|nr:VWA domain-containing protein [Paenibacillaceae bacterium]